MPNLDPFTIGLVLFVILVLGIVAYFLYNLAQPTVTRKARVSGKRRDQGSSTQYCTFEFEDGTRQEFTVSIDTFASLSDNDVGYLKTKGTVFWGFFRERAPSGQPAVDEDSLTQIKEALFRRQKITPIKLYREFTGAGLAEAKAAVERLEAELRAAEPDRFGG
jgi:hypothetical protein